MKPELLVNEHCRCGENPLYDEARGVLYWCDIPAGKVFALDLASGAHKTIYHDRECGGFTLQEDGTLLLFPQRDAVLLDPDSGSLTTLQSEVVRDTGRFNDCIADPRGRVFAGTMGQENQKNGALFSLGHDLNAATICGGTGCSNGLAFTPDLRQVYWCDSTARTVYLFDYDQESATMSNRIEWLQTLDWVPDGLTIDVAGNLWIAFYDGGFLRFYDSNANLIEHVDIPARYVTSCAFGGEDSKQLFVTTAGGKDGDDSLDGALFRLTPEIGGRPEFRSRISL
ncbi:MAG: SMP-30/gluconolactonase/LRE family protein [Armatimonadetes bacterium]|nr:SMP-30/gluconolactonase/LRE family protein [Armatimonadota bacterium]